MMSQGATAFDFVKANGLWMDEVGNYGDDEIVNGREHGYRRES